MARMGLLSTTTSRPLSTYSRHRGGGVGRSRARPRGRGGEPRRRAHPRVAVRALRRGAARLGGARRVPSVPPARRSPGVLLNAGCIAVWALTRITDVGGPFGSVEEVGFQDSLAALLAAIAVIGGTVALVRRAPGRAPPRRSRDRCRVLARAGARGSGDGGEPHPRSRAHPRRTIGFDRLGRCP